MQSPVVPCIIILKVQPDVRCILNEAYIWFPLFVCMVRVHSVCVCAHVLSSI